MLSEDKNKWCWSDNYGYVGEPQDTLQGAIDDYFEYNPDKPGERPIKVGPVSYTHLDVYKRQGVITRMLS